MMFLAILIAVLGGYYNYLLGLDRITIYPSYIGAGIGFLFYYLSRFRQIYHPSFIISVALMTITILSIVFFYNAGSAGPIILLDFCLFMIFLLMSHGWVQPVLLFLFLAHVILLYYLEYLHPEWIYLYQSTQERFLDVSITLTLSTLFLSIAIILFRNRYNNERQRVREQNAKLIKLNEDLKHSNIEVNEKNIFIQSLMKELNHRVKNNLQLVTSLLNIQQAQIKDASVRDSIELAKNRIVTIGLIHQKLYRDHLDLNLELSDYIRELCDFLIRGYPDGEQISINAALTNLKTRIEVAVHIGLMANELITNSLKHAWPEHQADRKIWISTDYISPTGKFELVVRDNGHGFMPSGVGSKQSFGLDLIGKIAVQYHGELILPKVRGSELKVILFI